LWVEYWVHNVQYRESTTSTNRKVAQAFLAQRIAEKKAAKAGLVDFVGPQRVALADLLDQLLDDYRIRQRKSLAETAYRLANVKRLLPGLRAAEVTTAKLRWYVARRMDEGAANATINRELAAIRRAFTLASQDSTIRHVPAFPTLPEHNVRRGFFEVHQFDLMVRSLPDYLQDVVQFAYLTGWRRGDITGLTWGYGRPPASCGEPANDQERRISRTASGG
jgi:integrase